MTHKLLKSTLVTAFMTLLSRISGLVRDIVFARLIGAGIGVSADAFYVAFRIPNFFRRIFGEGAFAPAFVPVFAEYRTQGDERRAKEFLDHVAGILLVALVIVTAIGTIAAPFLVMLLAPGFVDEPEKYALTVEMLRIMFPYLFFISLVAMAGGILNTHGRFGVPAFTPVLLNFSLIGAALWLAPLTSKPVLGLAWGVFIAGVVQLLFQVPALARIRCLPRPVPRLHDPGVRKVFKLMLPAVFSVSVAQINLLVNMVLASFLVTGSVSWLYYSDRIMEFPLGIFGVALGTVILPNLSKKHASASKREFSHTLDWALRLGTFISIPAMVALFALSAPILTTLFRYGAFTQHDVTMTTTALMAFVVGLPAFVFVKILAPGFYARQDMKTPVKIGVIAVVANIAFSILLVWPLKHAGLALATSVAAVVNAWLLFHHLRKAEAYQPDPGWNAFLFKVILASAIMGAVLLWDSQNLGPWLNATAVERVVRLAFWVVVGMLVYMGAILALGVKINELLLRQPQPAHGED